MSNGGSGYNPYGSAPPYAPAQPGFAPMQPGMAPAGAVVSAGNPVDDALREFTPDTYTVRFCNALFNVAPFAPPQPPYRTVVECMQAFHPQASPQVVQRAVQLASSPQAQHALKVMSFLDTADAGIAAFSGIKSIVGLFQGQGTDALETDKQQGVDAVVKFLGMAYFVHGLFPGGVSDQLAWFHGMPAGRAMEVYYAAIEVGLPFADNALSAGGSALSNLMGLHQTAATGQLAGLAGGNPQQAQAVASGLLGPVQSLVNNVLPRAKTIAQTMASHLPSAMNAMDKAAGAVATGADALPVYRYLGARTVAETCVALAVGGM